MSSLNTGPLAGLKLLDMGRIGAGPSCAMILADMGADTIKLEAPGIGDAARTNAPLVEDVGGYFPYLNRNKKSITLNLQHPRGKELFRRLIGWADIVVENFRPGVLARLGFPYETMRALNPGVILVSVSGFGQTGPNAQRASFDTVGQAVGGMMHATGRAVGYPLPAGAVIADLTGGLFATIGALLALHHREVTGQGQWVDTSIQEGQLYHIGLQVLMHARQTEAQRSAPTTAMNMFTYRMKDGAWMVIMYQDDNHWPRLARIIGRPDLANDPKLRTRAQRSARREFLHELVVGWAATVTADEAETLLEADGLPYAKVMTVDDLLADAHIKARHAIEFVEHPTGEVLPLVGVFPKLSETPGSIRLPCPHLGEHNEEVYRDILGLSAEEVAGLQQDSVI